MRDGFASLPCGSAWHGNNELPLLWPIHAKTRTLLFGLLDQMTIRTATQLGLGVKHRHARRDEVSGEIDLGFASQRWRSFVRKPHKDGRAVNRRALEVCVFIHLANALQTGDLYIIDSEAFADYRDQLLPWPDCQPRLADYCAGLGMPERAMTLSPSSRPNSRRPPTRWMRASQGTPN